MANLDAVSQRSDCQIKLA